MKQRVASLLNQTPTSVETTGLFHHHGTTVPADGATGYAGGCLFAKTDGGAGTSLYVNEGSVTSADFNALAGA